MDKGKMACGKLIRFLIVMVNGGYQLIVSAYGEKVDAKALFSLDIRIRMGVLIKISHHRKERCLVAMKTAPGVKTDIGLSIFLPCGNGK